MSALLQLKIMGRPPNLHSTGTHPSWQGQARVRRERRAMVKVLAQGARHAAHMDVATGKRRLHVRLWWHGTRRDDPNLLQDLKADVDGLVDAGWLVNDNREWLTIDYPPEVLLAVTKRDMAVEYTLYEGA